VATVFSMLRYGSKVEFIWRLGVPFLDCQCEGQISQGPLSARGLEKALGMPGRLSVKRVGERLSSDWQCRVRGIGTPGKNI